MTLYLDSSSKVLTLTDKKKEKKREVPPFTKQRRGIPWEYLSRMRSTVGTTGSCMENHTGSRFHQDLKARTRSRWYRKKRMKGWKKDGDTDRGWTHHCFSTHFLSGPLEDNACLASNHLYRALLNGYRFSFSPRWHVTALIK